jgi:hypothetical protein
MRAKTIHSPYIKVKIFIVLSIFVCLTTPFWTITAENMPPKRNPLEIPEIIRNIRTVGSFVVQTSEIASMQVSKTFHGSLASTSWETVVVDYAIKALYSDLPSVGGRLLPWHSLKLYGSNVRSVLVTSQYIKPPPNT